jgi:ABC-type transport system substrate-binding protein
VDKLSFKIIADMGLRVLALQAGTIDMDLSFIDSSYLETLNTDPNIGVYEALRNGYGQITINCREYPLNISGLR